MSPVDQMVKWRQTFTELSAELLNKLKPVKDLISCYFVICYLLQTSTNSTLYNLHSTIYWSDIIHEDQNIIIK